MKDSTVRSIRVNDEVWNKSKEYAAKHGTNISALINVFLKSAAGMGPTPAERALNAVPVEPSSNGWRPVFPDDPGGPAGRPLAQPRKRTGRTMPRHPENAPRQQFWDPEKCVHKPDRRRHLAIGEFCADCGAEMGALLAKQTEAQA